MAARRKRKKKKKIGRILVCLVILLLFAASGAVALYLYRQSNSGLFFEQTTLNDYDVSGMTAKEALLVLEKDYSAPKIEIYEQGELVEELALEEAGYTVDEKELLSRIQETILKQNLSLLNSLFEGNQFEVTVPFRFDEDTFEQAVNSKNLSKERTASVDAYMDYNGSEYYIQPEQYGTEFDDADLQVIVKEKIDALVSAKRPQEGAKIEIPSAIYFVPAVTSADAQLNYQMNSYNQYCKAVITHTFGSVKQTIDWETIKDWVILDGEHAYIDSEPLNAYVHQMAADYDTLYYDRSFESTEDGTIALTSNDYGYQIDQEGEEAQLLADIEANTVTEREPVYAVRGYSREGRDDLNGNYIEINLTRQHLWLYKEGSMVLESDFVSGLPKDDRETVTGAFPIAFKASPYPLKGGSGSSAWSVEVKYWMPFHNGQGLHDASWRSSFGGSIYLKDGSHGCVNLPESVAGAIYNEIDAGFPVLLYK